MISLHLGVSIYIDVECGAETCQPDTIADESSEFGDLFFGEIAFQYCDVLLSNLLLSSSDFFGEVDGSFGFRIGNHWCGAAVRHAVGAANLVGNCPAHFFL